MQMEGSAGDLLAAGTEASIEASFRTGEYERPEELVREALRRARVDGDRATEAGALDRLGWLLHFQALDSDRERAQPEAEEDLFRQALAIRRELGDQAGIAASLFGIGLVHQVLRDDWAAAMPYFREALELADPHADALVRSECHRHVGFYYAVEDVQPAEAIRHLRTSLELRREWGDPRWVPSGTFALGMAHLGAGYRDEGIALIRESIQQARDANLSARRIHTLEDWLRRAEAGETLGSR
jgi:tetratricopeptide (TPR) repeat protein